MFGLPRNPKDYTLKDYLRIVIIICLYLLLRPVFEKLFFKLSERGRKRMERKRQDELAKRHAEHRVREKLGLAADEDLPKDETKETAEVSESAVTSAKEASTEPTKKSISGMFKKKKPQSRQDKFQKVLDDFYSDEDVSDLID